VSLQVRRNIPKINLLELLEWDFYRPMSLEIYSEHIQWQIHVTLMTTTFECIRTRCGCIWTAALRHIICNTQYRRLSITNITRFHTDQAPPLHRRSSALQCFESASVKPNWTSLWPTSAKSLTLLTTNSLNRLDQYVISPDGRPELVVFCHSGDHRSTARTHCAYS